MAPVVVVTGTRGIPDVQGGVETHVENLYPLISKDGFDIRICCRSCYITADRRIDEYHGCKLVYIDTPRKKSLEAIVHTWKSILYAKRIRADIIHIHAVGPALLVPIARLLGLKVVFTHHGPDYMRAKWGWLAKTVLRCGESAGTRYASAVIAISQGIRDTLETRFKRKGVHLIPNGVRLPEKTQDTSFLRLHDLDCGRYILSVARFVEEKGLHDLIEAFASVRPKGWKLVLAGDADHETLYSLNLKKRASEVSGVVLTGFIKGDSLAQIYQNAGVFVLPSYHEGLPIAALEAMSYGLPILLSAIQPHKEMRLKDSSYFPPGSVNDLSTSIARFIDSPRLKPDYSSLLKEQYNWEKIAVETMKVYRTIL